MISSNESDLATILEGPSNTIMQEKESSRLYMLLQKLPKYPQNRIDLDLSIINYMLKYAHPKKLGSKQIKNSKVIHRFYSHLHYNQHTLLGSIFINKPKQKTFELSIN